MLDNQKILLIDDKLIEEMFIMKKLIKAARNYIMLWDNMELKILVFPY